MKLTPIRLLAVLAVLAPLTAPASAHEETAGHAGHAGHESHAMASAAAPFVDGVIKKVDKAAGKVTISHGPLVNLDMPAMTMVFRVKEAAWIDRMQPGEKIRFVADSINGVLTVVGLEAAK